MLITIPFAREECPISYVGRLLRPSVSSVLDTNTDCLLPRVLVDYRCLSTLAVFVGP